MEISAQLTCIHVSGGGKSSILPTSSGFAGNANYLQTMQSRQKWQVQQKNFAVDDVVLVYDEHTPRGKWPLGRVVETYPDKQGHV